MSLPSIASARVQQLRGQGAVMVDQLAALVAVETPSDDLSACSAGADLLLEIGTEVLGEPGESVEIEGRRHLRWHWDAAEGGPVIALLGHYDTVWPLGTLARWPFTVDPDTGRGTGPGTFDMKAGIVQMFHAVAALADRSGVEILLTCDEETGSQVSRAPIEELARRSTAALILEGSAAGALKIGRKGTGMYRLHVEGRASHAGLEPEKGANALTELAHLTLAGSAVGRPAIGTTVTPTLAAAGTASNVVPARSWVEFDVRVAEPDEAVRVDRELRALRSTVPGTTITVDGGPNRPPLPTSSTQRLFALAEAAAADLGLAPLGGVSVGGASDGNFTAAVGCPTLDGLGAVGDGAHAEGEYVQTAAMPDRAALLATLIERIRA